MKRSTAVLMSVLLALCCMQSTADAATLNGRSSTQAFFFSDEQESDHLQLAQYLRVAARKFDKGDTWRVNGYGRATGDLQQGDGVEGRLYYLYLDKKGLPGGTDLRLGRQFFFVGAGSALVDGARIDTRPAGPLAFTLVGGRNVLFSETGEFTKGGDMAAAAQLALTSIPDGSLNLSYLTTYDQSDLATEKLGLSGNKRFGKYGELFTQLRYDLLSEVWNEIEFGGRTSISKLTVAAEYFRSIPTFEATSIFSVFAVDRYQEFSLESEYEFSKKLAAEADYRNESYGEGATANVGELGLRFHPTDGSTLYAAGIWRNGDGGNMAGFEISGNMVAFLKYTLAAGVQYDVYKRDLMTGSESASRFWVGGEAKLRKDLSIAARLEDNVNENWNNDLRARLALNYDF